MVLLLEVEQMLAHLRLGETGRIAAVTRGDPAHVAQIVRLGGLRFRAQFQQLGVADERFRIGREDFARATLGGRAMR